MEKHIEMDFIVAQRILMNIEKKKNNENIKNKDNIKKNIKTTGNTNINLQKKICSHCGQLELWCMCLYY